MATSSKQKRLVCAIMSERDIELELATLEQPPADSGVEDGIGICLSGGGYRAMLFHVGALWRLNEVGLLKEAKRISAVSGGSITAGYLAVAWQEQNWANRIISWDEFEKRFASGICRLAGKTIDIPAILVGLLPFKNVGRQVAKAYDRLLFNGTSLAGLPDEPRFVFNSSNLQSGALWRFSKPYMGDYKVGLVDNPDLELAVAVAASSAFPPFLSPTELRFKDAVYRRTGKETLQQKPFTTKPRLSDGGVYDNLGLETVFKRFSTVLVSDGGALFSPKRVVWGFWPLQLKRVLDCIDNQVRSLHKREVMKSFELKQKQGAYWGIGTPLRAYSHGFDLTCSEETTARLAHVPTRLGRMSDRLQRELINWGYVACTASLACNWDRKEPSPKLPFPDAPLR